MRHGIVFLGFLLILLSLQFSSAQALSSCSGISVEAEDITIERKAEEDFVFYIYNDEDEDFHVTGMEVWKDYGDFSIRLKDFTDNIDAGDSGEITVTVTTGALNHESNGRAYIRARGFFDDGKYCNFGSIGETYFDVDVVMGHDGSPECGDIRLNASDVYIDEDSAKTVSFTIRNYSDDDFRLDGIEVGESSSFFDAELYSKPSRVEANDSETFKVRIEANNVSRDREAEVELRAKGRFENGDYCSYSGVEEETFTVTVEDDSDEAPEPEPEPDYEVCDDVFIEAQAVRVEKGGTGNGTIFLRNETGEDFFVDYARVFDSSQNFAAEETGYSKAVPAFGSTYINVMVRAHEYAETGTENAFVEVTGHFQGGESCRLSGSGISSFRVEVVEKPATSGGQAGLLPGSGQQSACTYFSLVVPEVKSIGKSGYVEIVIDNRTLNRANVRLSGPGITVEPKLISVPKRTLVSETVFVSSALGETNLVYSIEADGCNATKSTRIIADVQQDSGEEQEEETGDNNNMAGLVSAGLVSLGQASLILGIIALAAIIAYLILRR